MNEFVYVFKILGCKWPKKQGIAMYFLPVHTLYDHQLNSQLYWGFPLVRSQEIQTYLSKPNKNIGEKNFFAGTKSLAQLIH